MKGSRKEDTQKPQNQITHDNTKIMVKWLIFYTVLKFSLQQNIFLYLYNSKNCQRAELTWWSHIIFLKLFLKQDRYSFTEGGGKGEVGGILYLKYNG